MRHQLLVVVAMLAIGGCTQTPGSLSPVGPSELPWTGGPLQPIPDVINLSDTNPCHWARREPETCNPDITDQEPPVSTPMPIVDNEQPLYRFEPM
jgi:hypothetical protein